METLWQFFNKPLWTPIGLLGWMTWTMMLIGQPQGIHYWILTGIQIFVFFCWAFRHKIIKNK